MNTAPTTRLASIPFTIKMANDNYTLETTELEAQLDAKLLRKTTWFSPCLQFKSFRGKQLTLINSFQDKQYLLRILVEPDSLSVSCSCNQPVETLCLHSYHALREIAVFKSNTFFKQYAPGGWAATALANKKAFAFNHDKWGPEIKPLPPHEKIYKLNCNLPVIENLLPQPGTEPRKNLVVCYLILSFSRRSVPPILMPCLAVPAQTGNRVRSFLSFTETIAPANEHYFNDSRQILNKICLAMLKEAEQILEQNDGYSSAWQWGQYEKIFQLWQQCWPLLCAQPQVYYSHMYLLKYIKGKPRLRETIPVTVSPEKITTQFFVRKYPGHQRLSMNITHLGKPLQSEAGILPFFVSNPETDCWYLLPGLPIARLIAQMHDAGPFVSIFKQQYKAFQKEVIIPLQKQGLLYNHAAVKKKTKAGNQTKRQLPATRNKTGNK